MAEAGDPQRQRDAALLAAWAAGEPDAARRLVDLHAPRAYRLALRMLRDTAEAEEITQEAMLRLWRIAPQWRAGEARIDTWLYRVTANLCTDRLRRPRPEKMPEGFEAADGSPGAEARLQQDARAQALDAALAALPERQRLAIVLRHLEERSNPEIAAVMELSVEAVESLLSRGRRALRARLEGARSALGYEE
ncbi:RNA polymerase sigma factor [Halovulum dunhuangense]|uniref:RNA polymerase sigma factor n=1 Tax=Halovulum dunhuangense TaxID=1505036 RepID=A0A849L4Y0_9RHOB|nr:RNA polymerase sigma factor [Halovulum dunhuangense]